MLNLPLRMAAVGCTFQLTLDTEINKQHQLQCAKTLSLQLHHIDVIVLYSWH